VAPEGQVLRDQPPRKVAPEAQASNRQSVGQRLTMVEVAGEG